MWVWMVEWVMQRETRIVCWWSGRYVIDQAVNWQYRTVLLCKVAGSFAALSLVKHGDTCYTFYTFLLLCVSWLFRPFLSAFTSTSVD